MLIDLPLIRIDLTRNDVRQRHRAPGNLRFEDRANQRHRISSNRAVHFRPGSGAYAVCEFGVFHGQQFAVGGDKVEIVPSRPFVPEQRGGGRIEPPVGHQIEHGIARHLGSVVQCHLHRPSISVTRRRDRTARAENVPTDHRRAMPGVIVDVLPDGAIGKGQQPEQRILAGRLDPLGHVGCPLLVVPTGTSRVDAHPNRFEDARLPKNRLHRTEVVAQDIGVVHPSIERDRAA